MTEATLARRTASNTSTTTAKKIMRPADIDVELTPAALAEARALIGVPLRRRGHCTLAGRDLLLRYAKSIGCRNPMYTSLTHGLINTYWANLLAHPSILFCFDDTVVAPKLPGLHALYAGVTIEWFYPIRAGDTLRAEAKLLAVEEKTGAFCGAMALQTSEVAYTNQYGKEVFERLVARADVVLHNLAPAAAQRMGISYDSCRKVKPDIVYCHIQGYGEGPRHREIASNPVIEASTGVMHSHRVDGRPMRLGPAYHDQFAGTYAVIGILAGLAAAPSNKEARCIEFGLYEMGLHIAARDLAGVQLKQQLGVKMSASDGGEFALPGYGAYETGDARWIYIIMLTDGHWRKFCEAMAIPAEQAAAYATMRDRKKNRPAVEGIVSAAVKALGYDAVAARLEAAGVGYTEVRDFPTVLDEPQAQTPKKLENFSWGGLQFQVPNFPFQYDIEHAGSDAQPPLLGEHTRELMRSVGYSDAEIDAYLGEGAVQQPVPEIKWAPARQK